MAFSPLLGERLKKLFSTFLPLGESSNTSILAFPPLGIHKKK
jgi:hypothetical protein